MFELVPRALRAEPTRLENLFSGHPYLRAVIEGVTDGILGSAWVADDGDAARLDLGVYRILGGSAESTEASTLLRDLDTPCEIVLPPLDRSWHDMLAACHGPVATRRTMDVLMPVDLTAEHVATMVAQLPNGFGFSPCDAARAARIGAHLAPNRPVNFGSIEAFAEVGLGTVLESEGVIACACTPYSMSRRHVEIAIATHPDFRRRGLATPTAAHTIAACLERGLEPHWCAANATSRRIAQRLGFVRVGECELFDIESGPLTRSP